MDHKKQTPQSLKFKSYEELCSTFNIWLWGDSLHEISNRIECMYLNYLYFYLINQYNNLLTQAQLSSSFLSQPYVYRQVIRSFLHEQGIGIRLLLEPEQQDEAKKSISLQRVVITLLNNRDLITREAWVCIGGYPYEYQHLIDDYRSNIEKFPMGVVRTIGPNDPCLYPRSLISHQQFDVLSDVSESNRQKSDLIRLEWFESLQKLLDEIDWKNLRETINKVLLHGADQISRKNLAKEGLVPIECLDAIRIFWLIHKHISKSILHNSGTSPFSVTGDRLFKELSSCYFLPEKHDQIKRIYENLKTENAAWFELKEKEYGLVK